jgi:GTPase Era involved in 16S rRNA processing
MIKRAIQLKDQHHKQEIEELLAKQKEEINQENKHQLDAMTAVLTEQFSQRMAAQLDAQAVHYEECFRSLKGYRVVTSELEVTTERALHNVGSPARIILRSSADRTQGNNILLFIIS